MRDVICYLLLAALSLSCNEIERKLEVVTNKPIDADGISRDFPVYYKDGYKEQRLRQEKSIGLTSLENGSSYFQVRILKDFPDRTGWLLILTDSMNGWHSNLFTFKYMARNFSPDSLTAKLVFSGAPKSGWPIFLHKLVQSELLTLPDSRSLNGYEVDADATGMIIQIADRHHFRYYEYTEPYYMQHKFKEAKKAVRILELLQQEFPIDAKFRNKEFE